MRLLVAGLIAVIVGLVVAVVVIANNNDSSSSTPRRRPRSPRCRPTPTRRRPAPPPARPRRRPPTRRPRPAPPRRRPPRRRPPLPRPRKKTAAAASQRRRRGPLRPPPAIRSPHHAGEDDVALRGAVERVAGAQHQALVADLLDDADVARVDDLGLLHPVGEGRVGHLEGDPVAPLHRVDVAEGRQVGGAVAGDPDRAALAGERRLAGSGRGPSGGWPCRCPGRRRC